MNSKFCLLGSFSSKLSQKSHTRHLESFKKIILIGKPSWRILCISTCSNCGFCLICKITCLNLICYKVVHHDILKRNYLNYTLAKIWICCVWTLTGVKLFWMNYQPWSPDFTPCDIVLQSFIKNCVHIAPCPTAMSDLKASITVVTGRAWFSTGQLGQAPGPPLTEGLLK